VIRLLRKEGYKNDACITEKMSKENREEGEFCFVEEVHEKLDMFVLSIFEAVRGHEVAQLGEEKWKIEATEKNTDIHKKYHDSIDSIDKLKGMNRTEEDQTRTLDDQSIRIAALKEKILQYENELITRKETIDLQLRTHLNDDVLGLKSN
jgi:hypothetical protein